MPAKLQLILQKVKPHLWKGVCGFLALACIGLLIGYFSQGTQLSHHAFMNAQRLVIPLQGEGEWIGAQVKVKQEEAEKIDELIVPLIETEEVATESSEPMLEGGHAADLSGKVLETIVTQGSAEATNGEVSGVVLSEAEAEKPEPTKQVEAEIDSVEHSIGKPLAIAPDPELAEKKDDYHLPKISKDGKKPWQFYGKPFEDDGKPMVSVIISGLGLGRLTTESALKLDSHVTLSFSPYAKNTEMWASHARNIGHEVMLDLPQEGKNYPASDPGPYALLNTLDEESNRQRLHWVMSRFSGYVGFLQTEHTGLQSGSVVSAFTELAKRGLFFVESQVGVTENLTRQQESMGLITHYYDRRLDEVLSKEAIQKQLDLLIKDAKKNGTAIAVMRPYPLAMQLLDEWSKTLEAKGVKLAPASAIIDHDL